MRLLVGPGFSQLLHLCFAITKNEPFCPAMPPIIVVKDLVKSWNRVPGPNSQYKRQCPSNLDESAPDSCGRWSEVTQAATA